MNVKEVPAATPSPNLENGNSSESYDSNSTTNSNGNGLTPASHSVFSAIDEIEALKLKIAQLELRATNTGINPNLDEKSTGQQGENENFQPKLMSELERYKRMEECLYNHRKEWEVNIGPGYWSMRRDYFTKNYIRPEKFGPWGIQWRINSENEYERPDPFNSHHICNKEHGEENKDKYDEYDEAIDYGYHRERLRKNFEWEMDRLFLAEESDRRKRVEVDRRKEAEAERAQEAEKSNEAAKGIAEKKNDSSNQSDNKVIEEVIIIPYAEPRIKRLGWLEFKQLMNQEEKETWAIDVLVGEPVIEDNYASQSTYWYGYQPRKPLKLDRLKENKIAQEVGTGQSQLAERMRINSSIILKILAKILGSEGSLLDERVGNGPVIFTRPFKALTFYEYALRDWYTALEKKHNNVSESGKEFPLTTDASLLPLQNANGVTDANSSNDDLNDPSMKSLSNLKREAVDRTQTDHVDENNKGAHDEDGDEKDNDPQDITKSPTALEHLKCILDFVDSDISARKSSINSSQLHKVFFSDLWHHFRPGTEVIGNDGKQAYRVLSVTSPPHRDVGGRSWWNNRSTDTEDTSFTINCVYIDFDGSYLGPVSKQFVIKAFEGERALTSFDVYPLHFHPMKRSAVGEAQWKHLEGLPENQRTREMLLQRGKTFLQVIPTRHMYYSGPTLVERDEVESQVVIDFETAFSAEATKQHNWKPLIENALSSLTDSSNRDSDGDARRNECYGMCCGGEFVYEDTFIDRKQATEYLESLLPKTRSLNEQPSVAVFPRLLKELQADGGVNSLSPEELVIMSYRVFGFVLRSRKWAVLDLSYITDVHPSKLSAHKTENSSIEFNRDEKGPGTALDRLVLEDGHQTMIVSLISQHFRDKESAHSQSEDFDIVKGKGKGLILLLHGAPGVGKTSTAEGVAELFQKPLLQITCGDLGATAREVEKALEINFAMASRWGCILLLDEADIFLAERTREDYVRNGLVAVFLRILEYYNGILFLTTNRVGDFDEAFSSRIHVSLYYPELSQEKTVKVFELNLEMIENRLLEKGKHIKIDKYNIGSFAAKHFTDHEHARWNGRQIRNACQTALALAEFEAQGNDHRAVQKPEAVVELGMKHFTVVQKAYLEFAKYMDDVYGTTSRRRAKEAKLRAMRGQELMMNVANFSGMPVDKRSAFMSGLQSQQQVAPQMYTQAQPGFNQQNFQYQQSIPQQSQQQQQQQAFSAPQHYSQQASSQPQQPNMGMQQQFQPNPPQIQVQGQSQQIPPMQPWNSQSTGPLAAGGTDGHFIDQPRSVQSPYPQQPQQTPGFLQHGVEEMYAAAGRQSGQMAGNLDGSGENYPLNIRR